MKSILTFLGTFMISWTVVSLLTSIWPRNYMLGLFLLSLCLSALAAILFKLVKDLLKLEQDIRQFNEKLEELSSNSNS